MGRLRKLFSHLHLTTLIVVISVIAVLVFFRGLRLHRLLLGFLFGLGTSAVNFWMLSREISQTRYAPQEKMQSWILPRFLLRYCLIGIAFVICLRYPQFSLLGFLLGFVIFQLAIFWSMFRWWT